MKTIKQLLIFSLILLGSLFTPGVTHANSPQSLLFAVTPYQPLQNLDFFFTHSLHPLAYYEKQNTNTPIKTPVFLSIITLDQKQDYLNARYNPVIVDENAGNVEQYYVLYSRKPNQSQLLTNPEFKQQGLELVYPVTEYTTLIKLAPGIKYKNLDIPGTYNFRARKFFMDLVPPVDRTSSEVRQSLTFHPSESSIEDALDTERSTNFVFFLLIIITPLLIFGFYHFLFKKKK